MKPGVASIRKELDGIYSREEIESLIFLIFEKLKGYSRTQFLLASENEITPEEKLKIDQIIGRLKRHEPIQYILGETEFYGLPIRTVPGTLIPRPETEELVQWIVQETRIAKPAILDIGTGTGCIAVSLRKNIQDSTVWACDISPVCIETTRQNALLNHVEISVLKFDVLGSEPATDFPAFDVIVSNPPYVRQSEKLLMQKNVLDFEPELALFVDDDDPLIFYRRMAEFAQTHLKNGGRLYFEINEAFGKECSEMLQGKGFSGVRIKKDLQQKDRMLAAKWVKS
jgi:release factor glutamine methyltransferase